MTNQSFLDLELCNGAVSAESNIIETEIIDLQIEKEASCAYAIVGGRICYTVTVTNNSDHSFDDSGLGMLTFRDVLASNVRYIDGTFQIDGNDATPTIDADNVMTYTFEIPPHESVVITFCVRVVAPDSQSDPATET